MAGILFFLKLSFIVLQALSVLQIYSIFATCSFLIACTYVLKFSKDLLFLKDKIEDIFDEFNKIQKIINNSVRIHHEARNQITGLREILTLYDNQDMRKMAQVMGNCEEATAVVGTTLINISNLISDIASKQVSESEKKLEIQQEQIKLTDSEQDEINKAINEINLFKNEA